MNVKYSPKASICLLLLFEDISRLYVTGYPISVSGVITVPVSASVYQSMVASMQQQDGGVCVAPLVQVRPKTEPQDIDDSLHVA